MVASVSNTVYGIINDAMFDAGFLQAGSAPNSEQLSVNMRRLNDILNLWQTQGLKLFLLQEVSVNLVTNQATYVMSPTGDVVMTKPMRILSGYVLNTSNIRRPLTEMGWKDYVQLSQVTGNSGTISSYFVDKQATTLSVTFWPPPDSMEAANTAKMLTQIQADNPYNLESNVSFPQEWRIALRWALAEDICTGQPQAIMDRCSQRANIYKEMLEDWDVEDVPTMFAPDQRIGWGQGRFK